MSGVTVRSECENLQMAITQQRVIRSTCKSLSTLATKVAENGDKLSPETATKVAVSGNIRCRFWRQFVSVSGNFCRQCGQAISVWF